MPATRELKINIDVDNKEAKKRIEELSNATGQSVENIQSDIEGLNTSLSSMFKDLGGIALGAGVAAGLREITNDAMDLETEMAAVKTLFTGTDQEFADLQKSMVDFSKTTAGATQNLMGMPSALYDIISANSKLSNNAKGAMRVLEESTNIAAAGMTNLGTATNLLMTILNTFQMSVDDSAKVGNILFSVIQEGVGRLDDLAMILPTINASANALGIGFEEIVTILPFMSKRLDGFAGAGIPVARMLDDLRQKSDKLAELGIMVYDEGKLRSLEDIVKDIQKAFKGMEDQQVGNALEQIQFEKTSQRAFINIVKGGDEVIESMHKITNVIGEGTAATKALNDATNTTDNEWRKAMANMKAATIDLGTTLLKVLRPVYEAMGKLEDGTIKTNLAFIALIGSLPILQKGFLGISQGLKGFITLMKESRKPTQNWMGMQEQNNILLMKGTDKFKSFGQVIQAGTILVTAFIAAYQFTRLIMEATGLDEKVQGLIGSLMRLDEIDVRGDRGLGLKIDLETNSAEIQKEIDDLIKENAKASERLGTGSSGTGGTAKQLAEIKKRNEKIAELREDLAKNEEKIAKLQAAEETKTDLAGINERLENRKISTKEAIRLLELEKAKFKDVAGSSELDQVKAINARLKALRKIAKEEEEEADELSKKEKQLKEKLAKDLDDLETARIEHQRETNQISLEEYKKYWENRLKVAQENLANMPEGTTEQKLKKTGVEKDIINLQKKIASITEETQKQYIQSIEEMQEKTKEFQQQRLSLSQKFLQDEAALYGIQSDEYKNYLIATLSDTELTEESKQQILQDSLDAQLLALEQAQSAFNLAQAEGDQEKMTLTAENLELQKEQYIEYLQALLELDTLTTEQRIALEKKLTGAIQQEEEERNQFVEEASQLLSSTMDSAIDGIVDNFGKGTESMGDFMKSFISQAIKDFAKLIIKAILYKEILSSIGGLGGFFGRVGGFFGLEGGGVIPSAEKGLILDSFKDGYTGNKFPISGDHKRVIQVHGGEAVIKRDSTNAIGVPAALALNKGNFKDAITLMSKQPKVKKQLDSVVNGIGSFFSGGIIPTQIPSFQVGGLNIPEPIINQMQSMAGTNSITNNKYDQRTFDSSQKTENTFNSTFHSFSTPDKRIQDKFYKDVIVPSQERYNRRG